MTSSISQNQSASQVTARNDVANQHEEKIKAFIKEILVNQTDFIKTKKELFDSCKAKVISAKPLNAETKSVENVSQASSNVNRSMLRKMLLVGGLAAGVGLFAAHRAGKLPSLETVKETASSIVQNAKDEAAKGIVTLGSFAAESSKKSAEVMKAFSSKSDEIFQGVISKTTELAQRAGPKYTELKDALIASIPDLTPAIANVAQARKDGAIIVENFADKVKKLAPTKEQVVHFVARYLKDRTFKLD